MTSTEISSKIRHSLSILSEMHGLTEADLCKKIKISQATLWRLFNGDTDPRASTLNTIAKYFNITVDQLIGNSPITTQSVSTNPNTQITNKIPIFQLKNTTDIIKNFKKSYVKYAEWLDVENTINNNCFAIEIFGESMWPLFIEKSLIIVDPSRVPENKNFILCKPANSQEVIIRQYVNENNELLLKAVNSAYKTVHLESEDIILGVVIQSKNKFIE